MFCKYCGNEMPKDSLFCPKCGQRKEDSGVTGNIKRCEACKKEFSGDRLFCDSCGGALVETGAMKNENQPVQVYPSSMNHQSIDNMPFQGQPSYGSQIPPAGMTQPPQYSYSPTTPAKKKRVILPVILITLFATLGVLAVAILSGVFSDKKPNNTPSPAVSTIDPNGGTNVPDSNTNESVKPIVTHEQNYQYSYVELPDVISLDSDKRFIYSGDYNEEGIAIYAYLFYDETAADADFYRACDDYIKLLQEENGFIYEEEFTNQQYEQTGMIAEFLSREEYLISITATNEGSLRYAYISIIPIDGEVQDVPVQEANELPNYNNYLLGREIKNFTFDETVNMDNGLSFSLYNVLISYNPDQTMTVEVILDLSSYYSDYYFNNGDFMVFPMDTEGYVIADAQPISYITDSEGYLVTMPFLVNASAYRRLTFTYAVPIDTYAFSIYATNYIAGQSTPVYMMDVVYDITQ